MHWIIMICGVLILTSVVIYQKIQKKETKIVKKTVPMNNDDPTEILEHKNKTVIQINLPSKTVHVKRELKDALFVGQIIFEKYKVVDVMHVGQMSHVYLVKHLVLGNHWCLKIVTTYDNTGVFQEEGILKQMNYQMIPKMIDIFYKGNIVPLTVALVKW